jgi:hypothetical protein
MCAGASMLVTLLQMLKKICCCIVGVPVKFLPCVRGIIHWATKGKRDGYGEVADI